MNQHRRKFLGGTFASLFTTTRVWAMHRLQAATASSDRLFVPAIRGRSAPTSTTRREMATYRDPHYPLVTQQDFPVFLADHLGIHNVEFLPQHFASIDPSSIEKVKAQRPKEGSIALRESHGT